jgi:hypothetical protein
MPEIHYRYSGSCDKPLLLKFNYDGEIRRWLALHRRLGPYSAYKRKGSDEIFIKSRPGKTGKKAKDRAPWVQENVTEFSLTATAFKAIPGP